MRRKTSQYLIPALENDYDHASYDIYPAFPIEKGAIREWFAILAKEISMETTGILDGYIGVDWDVVCNFLRFEFQYLGINPCFINTADFMKPESEIKALAEPYLGGDGWEKKQLPIHREHFYNFYHYHFKNEICMLHLTINY